MVVRNERNDRAAFILTSAIIFETTEADVMISMHYLLPKWSGENFRRRVHGIHLWYKYQGSGQGSCSLLCKITHSFSFQ